MFAIEYTSQFKKDLKRAKRRGKCLAKIRMCMKQIASEDNLPQKLRDHSLSGNWQGHRELHIEPDWLLIYKLLLDEKTVIFVRTGSHSDLF